MVHERRGNGSRIDPTPSRIEVQVLEVKLAGYGVPLPTWLKRGATHRCGPHWRGRCAKLKLAQMRVKTEHGSSTANREQGTVSRSSRRADKSRNCLRIGSGVAAEGAGPCATGAPVW